MNENPYQTPVSTVGLQPSRFAAGPIIFYLANSVVVGALSGVALLFFYSWFILVPAWEGQLYKGDPRLDTIQFIASTILPLSAIAGFLTAIIGFRFTSFRFQHKGLLISCFSLWVFISLLRPSMSRVRRPGIPTPTHESVPDSMGAMVFLLFVALGVSAMINRINYRKTLAG